jgi:hypothetical protein
MSEGRRLTGANSAGEWHEPLRGGGPRECENRECLYRRRVLRVAQVAAVAGRLVNVLRADVERSRRKEGPQQQNA